MGRIQKENAGQPVTRNACVGERITMPDGIQWRIKEMLADQLVAVRLDGRGISTRDERHWYFKQHADILRDAVYSDYELRPCGDPDSDCYVPEHTFEAIDRYIFRGDGPSGFLTAVLENNLKGAISNADSENLCCLVSITLYIINRIPDTAWGDRDTVRRWIDNTQNVRERSVRGFYI